LTNEDDWKLAYASALALAGLDAKASLAAMDSVQKSHWYPPVRKTALAAKRHIESGEELAESEWWTFSSAPDSPSSCGSTAERTVRESPRRKLYGKAHARQLERLAYESAVRSYGPPDDAEPDEHGVIEMNDSNLVERVTTIRQVPTVALKIADGWLLGSDRGEWGGELLHMPADGSSSVLFDANIENIFTLGDHVVATSGLAHLFLNDGILLKIELNSFGRYIASPWKRLPAAPVKSSMLKDGSLLVDTHDGGSVVIDATGTIRMAECKTVVSPGP
jgi:hypothetical protein